MLLDSGADASAVGGQLSALSVAMCTESPNERIITRLLEDENRLHTSEFMAGRIMRWAIENGHLRLVNLMIENVRGFDPTFEWTVLGPRIDNPDGFLPNVCGERRRPFQRDRLSYVKNCSSPYQAIFYRQTEIVEALVAHWTNVNKHDYECRAALYWAAFRGDEISVRLLLQMGAWPDIAVRGYGWKAKDWASRPVRQLLLEKSMARHRPRPTLALRHASSP